MEKLYDNIDISKLVTLGLQYGYPRRLMSLGLHMHTACRGLKSYNSHPGHTMPTNGIIAGCTQSTSFAKVLLMETMQNMYDSMNIGHVKYEAQLRTFVDDIRITVRGTQKHIYNQYKEGLPKLIQGLRDIGCKISTKTIILSSSQDIRLQSHRILPRTGVRAQRAMAGKDLGICTTAGGRRSVAVLSKRIKQPKREPRG